MRRTFKKPSIWDRRASKLLASGAICAKVGFAQIDQSRAVIEERSGMHFVRLQIFQLARPSCSQFLDSTLISGIVFLAVCHVVGGICEIAILLSVNRRRSEHRVECSDRFPNHKRSASAHLGLEAAQREAEIIAEILNVGEISSEPEVIAKQL